MMKRIYTLFLLILFFLACADPSSAQKVAVVLSGGGSKGVCHIGVLKALEEARIPIDYIAGTSMGAIIGGLYAAGYSPSDMERIITSEEFKEWVSGKIDPKYVFYFRQPYPDASWMTFRFRYDSVLQTQLPTNIVSPVRMDFAFLELFANASAAAGYNFDSLMIPFRCVASDVQENSPVILRKGDLGSAIRASMTFPFYFKPIRLDGRLLFDGGMYNNFPADVAYSDFFPDIIIGSKAANNAAPPSDDNVVSQLTNMLMEKSQYDVLCESGVMIEPQLKQVNVIDFSHTHEFIDSGYVAAWRMVPEIRKFVVDSINPDQREAIRSSFNKRKPEYIVKDYSITGLTGGQYSYIRKLLYHSPTERKRKSNQPAPNSLEQVKADYFRLLAEGRVSHTYPSLVYSRQDSCYKLNIQASRENNLVAGFGGNISSKANNEVFLQLQYNYWSKIAATMMMNTYIGRFYNSVKLGGRIEFPSRVPFFTELYYTFNQFNFMNTSNTYFFNYETPLYLRHSENFADARMGFPLKNHAKIEFGFDAGRNVGSYYQTNNFPTKDTLDKTFLTFFSPFISLESSNLNRKQYANKGERFFAQTRLVNSREEYFPGSRLSTDRDYEHTHNYLQFNIVYEKYFVKKGPYTAGIYSEVMMSFQHLFHNYSSSLLSSPAFQPLPEMTTLFLPSYRSPVYFAVGQQNVFTMWKNFDIRLEGYLMAPYREILQNKDRTAYFGPRFKKLSYTASATLVYQSPIGPLSASYTYYPDEETPFSFFINLGYILFNRESLK